MAYSSTTVSSGCGVGVLSLGRGLGALSHVGGGAHGPLPGTPRRQGEGTGTRGSPARPLARAGPASPRSSGLYCFHHVCPIPLALASPPAQHSSRHTVLGPRRPHRGFRHQQRLFRRPRRRTKRLARHLSHGAGRRGQRPSLSLYRRRLSMPRNCSGASATPISTASTTRCPCASPPTGSLASPPSSSSSSSSSPSPC